ncbi:long-chain fatty acid--CoA ligase [Paenarthrobacter nitroguajacolicus]|uniref:Long-chain fatty acid--CoA ligase n=1 Tax=Paenarthrobacter nitroguajacolicus TaxID=211146 RepID=A0A558HBU2_PAENT|nr:AMP-dependent synthetase/ligase [Paenarthrobacter nitroguajacolicus]TVU66603.1 long-chain fatty acid--CoA ligase [Paenarthrobacter nitroguajacolicus]
MREASTELLVEADPNTNVTDLLLERCAKDPFGILYAHKTANGWLNVSAARFLADVTALAKGLIAGGLNPGDPVAVLSRSSFEWTLVDFAIWMAGGVTVPIYETSSASQIEWILADSGARRIFVEDAAKAGLVHTLVDQSTELGDDPVTIVRMEHDGDAPNLTSVSAVGIGIMDAELERQRSAANLADVASIVYTSGTTGKPKGCEITHGNFVLVARNVIPFLPELLMQQGARTLMFLPLAHVLARAVQVVCLTAGITLGHSAGASGLMADLGSFKPTFLLAVPRIFEKVYAGADHKAAMSGKSALFSAASATAVEYSTAVDLAARGQGTGPGWLLGLKHTAFNKLLYPKVREVFGGNVGYTVSGASPLSLRDNHFFHGAGVPVLEGYGLTETTAPCTVNTPSMSRIGTVGIPLPGTTIRVAQDGEVLVKGIGVFKGYHHNDAANEAAFVDGFFRTGDLGELDADGFLTITGRKKDLLVTAGGKNVAPGPLEEKLREHPLVGQAVVVGDGRPFVAALVSLDPDGLADWCEQNKYGDLTLKEAAGDDRVRAAVQSAVDEANKLVSAAESIKKFAFITAELSVESGHLTPSLKLKRAAVVGDFSSVVEKLFEK